MSDFNVPFKFPNVGPFIADRVVGDFTYTESFINGNIDSLNIGAFEITGDKIGTGALTDVHFAAAAVTNIALNSTVHAGETITKEKIASNSIGTNLTSGILGGADNIRALFTLPANSKKVRFVRGRAPSVGTILPQAPGLTTFGPYNWNDVCFAGGDLTFREIPKIIIPTAVIDDSLDAVFNETFQIYSTTDLVTFFYYTSNPISLATYISFLVIDIGGY